jgi:hypothetical protein
MKGVIRKDVAVSCEFTDLRQVDLSCGAYT